MRAIVVYESMYGNTRRIAEAIGDGLREQGDGEVAVLSVRAAGPEVLERADLVVVGGPTHVHGMSRPTSRQGAVEQLEGDLRLDPDAEGDGVREWLEGLGPAESRSAAAAFDTRVDMSPIITGRASKGISKELRRHGFRLVAEPTSFLVTKETHLESDQVERARDWGRTLARTASESLAHRSS